jgi:phosphatidylserine/phosphatidylglycerophosphate/cardiolipin synthase-like enzyme
MSELSIVDWMGTLLGSGPGAAAFAQPLSDGHTVALDFARPDPDVLGVPADHVKVELGTGNAELRAPMNGLLWRIPDFSVWTDERKARWPRLAMFDTDEFSPLRLGPGDLILEVWASAFRRMEQLCASLELPPFDTAEHPPSRPVARWFVFRGVPAAASDAAVTVLVDQQFFGADVPTLEGFQNGDAPIYVEAGEVLASLLPATVLQLRAFDKTAQVIDPIAVFETFATLAADTTFHDLARPTPTAAQKWSPPATPRHVLVFTDHRGKYYRPWGDFDGPDSSPPSLAITLGADTLPFPENPYSIAILEGAVHAAHAGSDPLLTLEGEHVRVGLHPDGIMKREIRLPLAQFSFLRIQVNDWREWFPRRKWGPILPGDDLVRYSEHNEIVPMTDGVDTARRMYRAIRATYRDETYEDERDIPLGAPFPPPDPLEDKAQVLLANAWTSADFFLMGRRAMLTTPRFQPEAVAPDDLLDGLRLIPVTPVPVPEPGAGEARYAWWLIAPAGTLPPGAWVELQQLEENYSFVGDDPRHPEKDRASDLFGVLAAPQGKVSAFVGSSGQLALPVTLAASFTHAARLRVVIWHPEGSDDGSEAPTRGAGRGEPHQRRYPAGGGTDGFTLPVPSTGPEPPAFSSPLVTTPPPEEPVPQPRLDWSGVPGEATLVVPAGMLTGAASVVALNARTGDVSWHAADVSELRASLTNIARRDLLLVAFLPPGSTELADASHLFQVATSSAAEAAGVAPVHPLELGGVLREAIESGVDVRLLAWRDNSVSEKVQLGVSVGMVHLVNAQGSSGSRGQAISDPTGREVLGVHHQKGSFIRTRRDGIIAFVGGMDTKLTRWDTPEHRAVEPERPHPPWHDTHCQIRGRAAWDVYRNIQQRWNVARALPEIIDDSGLTPLPAVDPVDVADTVLTFSSGTHAVQINRTIAPEIDRYAGFVDPTKGDLSARESYRTAFARARHFLYIEDQYLWDRDLAARIRAALVSNAIKFVILVLPRTLSEAPVADLVLYAVRRRSLGRILYGRETPTDAPGDAAGDLSSRVLILNPHNDAAEPTYVHCKMILADDLWMSIGSANMSRRSMTYDSELTAASIDTVIRRGARRSIREFRTALLASHLGLHPAERPLIEDPDDAFAFTRRAVDGEVPWLLDRIRCQRHDLDHTHYGFQPNQEQQASSDALRFALDSDGELTHHGVRFIDFIPLLQGADPSQLSEVSSLQLTFDLSALSVPPLSMPPADFGVRVEIREIDAPQPLSLGPFRGDQQVAIPVRAGREYLLSAFAALRADPHTVLARAVDEPVTTLPYVSPLTLSLAPI